MSEWGKVGVLQLLASGRFGRHRVSLGGPMNRSIEREKSVGGFALWERGGGGVDGEDWVCDW